MPLAIWLSRQHHKHWPYMVTTERPNSHVTFITSTISTTVVELYFLRARWLWGGEIMVRRTYCEEAKRIRRNSYAFHLNAKSRILTKNAVIVDPNADLVPDIHMLLPQETQLRCGKNMTIFSGWKNVAGLKYYTKYPFCHGSESWAWSKPDKSPLKQCHEFTGA